MSAVGLSGVARAALPVFLSMLLSACGVLPRVGPDYAGPPRGSTSLPAASAADPGATGAGWQARLPHGGDRGDLARWWSQFDDPALDAFLEAGQRESGTVAQAAARIAQAQAAVVAAGAAGMPGVDGSAGIVRGTINVGTSVLVATQTSALARAGWEIDLFGRIAREREAASARLQARTADWHEARVSVAAEVAAVYLQYRYCEALVAIAEADAASRTQTATVSARAAEAGFQAPAAAALARASAAEASVRLTAQRAECELAVKALVELTALPEPAVRAQLAAGAGRLPEPREFEVRTVPADLLSQRPDLASAERALAAASADIGVAEGDRYPRLVLSGSIGPLRLDAGSVGTTLATWSIGPSLSLPLYDGGRRAATVEAARAAYGAAEADFRARARQAVREVEEALVRLQAAADRAGQAATASAGYRVALEAAQQRWRTGLGSLLELEESRRLSLAADATLAAVGRDRIAAWVALYRALGGGWTNRTQESSR